LPPFLYVRVLSQILGSAASVRPTSLSFMREIAKQFGDMAEGVELIPLVANAVRIYISQSSKIFSTSSRHLTTNDMSTKVRAEY
jgi:hypothetical protein